MKRFLCIALLMFLSVLAFAQSRRLGVTRSTASQRQSEVHLIEEPNYDPVITKLGKVLDIEDGVAYVKITSKYLKDGEGYYYFYVCNLKAEATAMLSFRTEEYRDIVAMDITEGTCDKGDYVYMRFVPKAPMDVILPF